jgi:NitT/TauT family transport system ATP-binding protein
MMTATIQEGVVASDKRLQCVDVSVEFRGTSAKGVAALTGVSFDLKPGEFLSIVGPSGCGKTTLLNVLAGLVMPTAGTAFCDGDPIKGPSSQRTVMFQEYGLFPWMTVQNNVEFGLKAKGIPTAARAKIATQYIEMMGLKGFEDHYPDKLSGGMRQRVGIARALAPDPEIVLMDEPFGALDSITRKALQLEMLRIVRATNKTFVLITHDIEEAIFLADVVMVLSARPGRIKKIVRTELPRERSHDMRSSDERFLELEGELSALLVPS